MKAGFTNDTARGPGYGTFTISEAGPLAASDGIRFSLQRASDRKCLGTAGWQPATTFLAPEELLQEGTNFSLRVGPAVVDSLDALETYRLTLQGSDGEKASAVIQISEVIYSPLSGGPGILSTPDPAARTIGESRITSAPEAAFDQGASPSVELPQAPLPAQQPNPAISVDTVVRDKDVPDTFLAADRPVKRPRISNPKKFGIIALLLVLYVIGKLALLSDQQPSPPEPPLVQARAHLAGSAEPLTSFELAEKFRSEENGADAAFLLAEDAAQKGVSDAMLLTGDFYAPSDPGPSGSIQKDPATALSWYTRALQAGNQGALARLEALRAWAEKEAAAGSDPARDVLEAMNQ